VKLLVQLVLAMAVVAGATAILARMHLGSCVDLPVHDEPSPDGRFVATRFDHSCTGSTIATTEVSLRAATLPFGTPAPDDVVLIASGRSAVDLSWRDGRTLVARTAGTIVEQRPSWRSIAVVIQTIR
jgi:hypothetical protein